MTPDNLIKFLNDREYLHQISYQELKSLVVQYPYSLSLRYLLAIKSEQEAHQDLQRNMEMLATYGIDRSHLFNLIKKGVPLEALEESVILQEDYLELKELSALERELEEKTMAATTNDLSFIGEESKEMKAVFSDWEEKEEGKEEGKESVDEVDATTSSDTEARYIEEQNGLPADAVEINDLYGEEPIEEEEEVVAEEAASDSPPYIEQLEEVLEETPEGKQAEIVNNHPEIPFEIVQNEEKPISNEKEIEEGASFKEKKGKESEKPALLEGELANDAENGENLDVESFSEKITKLPTPKTGFLSWEAQQKTNAQFSGYTLLPIALETLRKERNSPNKKKLDKKIRKQFSKTVAYAEKSLKMGADIASETLAQLLAEQGHYDKAQKMYEQLCLIFPEKSTFFAAEIDKIRNLKNEIE